MLKTVKHTGFRAATQLAPCNIEDTIVVSGSPRSGTTWFAELFRELPGYKMLNEPLSLNSSVPAQSIRKLEWRTHLPLEDEAPEVERLLHRALTGRIGIPHMWRFQASTAVGRLVESVRNRSLVVKLIRAGRMLPWFSARFPVRALVSIFRHPCAVVASQMGYQTGWRNAKPPKKEEIRTGFFGTLPDTILERFGDVLSDVDTTASYLAAVWSLDTHMTLRGPIRGSWFVTTYEEMVQNAEVELRSILDGIDEAVPTNLMKRVDEPSNSAAEDLKTEDIDAQLTKWERNLSNTQIDSILRVVDAFAIDFYTQDPLPDRNKLDRAVRNARHDDSISQMQQKK
jgi:hypothetical protein